MSRYNFSYSLDGRINTSYEFNNDWVGEEDLFGSLFWNKNFSEEWLGLTWAIPLNDYWNVGITNFLTVISQSASYQYDLQALGKTTSGDNQVAILKRNRFRAMNHFGYIAKLGISYAKKNISLGLTVTTPKAHINGSGSLLYEEILAGYENSAHPESNNILESHFSENAEVKFKSPLSVGIGGGYNFGRNVLHVSAEWFNKVDKYYLLIPEPFIGQTSGEKILNRYIDERKSVINYGAGIEWGIVDSLSFYTSFATDFSSLIINNDEDLSKRITDGYDNSFFSGNIYNYGGGFDWILKKFRLTIGCVYSRGIQTIPQIVRFPEDANNPDTNPDDIKYTDLIWERWRVLVGFSMSINKTVN